MTSRTVALIISVAAALLGCARETSVDEPKAVPSGLDGCPYVGGSYSHDGRWSVCYACTGESVTCVPVEVLR